MMDKQAESFVRSASPVVATAPDQPPDLLSALPEPLRCGASLAMAASGCDEATAIVIALGAQGAAAGPSHWLKRPSGAGRIYPAIDLLLVDRVGGRLADALRLAMEPICSRSADTVARFAGLDPARIRAIATRARALRSELDAEVGKIDARLKEIKDALRAGRLASGMGPCSMEDAELEARRKQLLAQGVPLAIRESEAAFALRPAILLGGLTPRMVREWGPGTFDGHAADALFCGDAVRSFLGTRPTDLREILHFVREAQRGGPVFAIGAQQFFGASVALLWCCGRDDAGAVIGHPAFARGPLADRLLVLPSTGAADAGRTPAPQEQSAAWARHISDAIMRPRICGVRADHALDGESAGAQARIVAESAAAESREDSPAARAHLRQFPDLVLRLALGLHAAGPGRDRREISGEEHALAERIAREASVVHLGAIERFSATGHITESGMGADVELMVGKLRAKGPCSRRELFRSFHSQDYSTLKPLLDAAIQGGQIVVDGDRLLASPIDVRQRVSASAEVKHGS